MQKYPDIPNPAWQINILSASATELLRRGQIKEATVTFERILEVAPYHVQALDFLARCAYEKGDMKLSLELLERSHRSSPNRAITYQNMGIVYKAQGDYLPALETLNRALQVQPINPMALLQKGSILEILRQRSEAICAYVKALSQLTDSPQPPNFEQVVDSARALVAHAHDVIFKVKSDMLNKVIELLRKNKSSSELKRIEEFFNIYLGKTLPVYSHTMQHPDFLYFPYLQPQEFFNRAEFSWMQDFERSTEEIRAELITLFQDPGHFKPYVDIAGSDAGPWKELNNSNNWGSFHFYKYGERAELNCNRCPVTTAAVNKLPLIQTSGHSPEVFFSILNPGAHIPPHYGLTNYKATVHLPLLVPDACAIRVGKETRKWSEGQCLIFDDSFEHEAWNNSNEIRALLILEVWNPQLSTVERQAVSAMFGAIQDFENEYGPVANVNAN
jgi:tetratricopeptide (TPR) repeat protein